MMPAQTQRILIVDDDSDILRLWTSILAKEGYFVSGTTSGKEAINLVIQSPPDLLITDLSMPDVDGFEVLKAIRNKSPGLRIIVASGAFGGPILESAKYFGAAAIVQKPISRERLMETVRSVLSDS